MRNKSKAGLAGALMGVCLVSGLAGFATTDALWSKSASAPGAVIQNGDIGVSIGDTTYTQTVCSADVPVPDPNNRVLKPGQKAIWSQDFHTKLVGDNAQADILMSWSPDTKIPSQWTATYQVFDASGKALIPATAVGSPATVPNVAVAADTTYKAVITLAPKAGSNVPDFGATNTSIDVNGLVVKINQKR